MLYKEDEVISKNENVLYSQQRFFFILDLKKEKKIYLETFCNANIMSKASNLKTGKKAYMSAFSAIYFGISACLRDLKVK